VKRVALAVAVGLAAGALVGTPAASTATSQVRIVEAQGPAFPVKTYVLSLATGRRLTLRNVHVTENGSPPADATLTPASQASPKTFGVVLVRDTSFSMTGKPAAAALAAEQAFVAQRNPNEQVGLLEFNRKTAVVQPLTTSSSEIAAALAKQPTISGGTHIYDAVGRAESMLSAAHITSGSIVVLSDGADTGSKKSVDQVAHSALRRNTRIYAIGLNDAQYQPATLAGLAAAGHGAYAQAKAGNLTPLYHKLGRQLSNEYLLQYKSLLPPDKPAHVEVSVNGVGASAAAYRTPAIPVNTVPAKTYHPSVGGRVWGSTITMLLLVLLGAGAVAFLAFGVFQPRRSNLPARMAEFVSIRELQRDNKGGLTGPTPVSNPSAPLAAAPESRSPWTRFEEMLEIAEINVEPGVIILGTVLGTALLFLLIYAGTGSLGWALFAFGMPYIVKEWILRTLKRRRDKFAEQLPDALQVVASALRSGHSFAGALAVVVEGGSEPMKSELQRVVADEQLGVPIQDSLAVVSERMASTDIEQLALVAELQREAGGNSAEVIDRVAETVRERFDLKRLVKTLTTQGRLSRWIVSGLPVFLIIVIHVENPHYLDPLLHTTGGKIVFGLAAAWAVLGSLMIKRIVEIEV
jgi:tight adherence protein B